MKRYYIIRKTLHYRDDGVRVEEQTVIVDTFIPRQSGDLDLELANWNGNRPSRGVYYYAEECVYSYRKVEVTT